MSYLTNYESCRALWGLQAVGAAVPVGAMDAEAAMKVELAEIEEGELREAVDRYGRAMDLVAGDISSSMGEEAVEPFLQSSLRQIRGHYPVVFEGVELDEGKLETDAILRNIAPLPAAERSQRVSEAMNDLIYAILLHVKMKLGMEVERRLSDRVARVLESVD
jgi:hypothetical protein